MAKKNLKKTKSKIVSAAWKLFYEQGYEDTTIEEIIEESGTSKGSFYHYFEGKDALLGSLAYMMDEKYEELEPTIADDADSYEVLLYLNRELLTMIEETINMELLTRLYSTQLTTHGDRPLLDHGRTYYKLLRKIITRGQEQGTLRADMRVNELVRYYAMCERALLYEWCLRKGEYSLSEEAECKFPMMIASMKTKN
ncbi:MAG: helix-turn-helix domain containing protein [Clostridiaceae bacterium]|jgi:putative transcriptional regulator|uniref:Helix-turn-helix domain-containing protein n=1 Tax=Hominiventricola aquisgranensis TaxID=3133164 RepID=A0ABV1I4D1_9FIRM|nr:TetR/AcrR family transcriptional regulator [Clostridiaceae bacterium]MDY4546693.1 helix-turn-helix domain-containing protein [Candidatus Choladocola sp.]RGD94731.1 TetR/AcrR family transcriptional regulator [Clostridiales bacterium AM23-16LB]RHO81202.1 TetR/AcrR family transcriptional regulator [Clostridiaceae bacterium AF42-6]RHP51271.1 TetR/AcrR family transcriptional regulator [Clostridiaceae bacterium AF31-3BH]RHR46397.1 TetR/AcrR family transcriptional regulator [Clostridiaceae bacteri